MDIIVVDDEALCLRSIQRILTELLPGQPISYFERAGEALAYAKENPVDVAFLDIELGGMSGLELALGLKQINGNINVIFLTGYSDYMGNALSMHASGYILKPADLEGVLRELEDLRYPVAAEHSSRIRIKCFGSFEVYIDGKRVPFTQTKSKELLAYLVFRNGSSVNKKQIAAILWEDKLYNRSLQQQTQKVIARLEKKLAEYGAGMLLERSWGQLAVNCNAFTSDYRDLLDGDVRAINSYHGEYMSEYSWAEIAGGDLATFLLKS